jgi:WD40 repeat protein
MTHTQSHTHNTHTHTHTQHHTQIIYSFTVLSHLLDPFKTTTQVHFVPDQNLLLCGMRKSDAIYAWDLRKHERPLFSLHRPCHTNQHLSFAVNHTGSLCFSGTTADTAVHVYDLKRGGTEVAQLPGHSGTCVCYLDPSLYGYHYSVCVYIYIYMCVCVL